MHLQTMQQNLNQIMQICNQLSQNERNASQQLQRCVQLAQQISSQMNQLQMTAPGYGMGAQAGGFNVSPGAGGFSPGIATGGQFGGTPGYGIGQWSSSAGYEMAREYGGPQAQHPVFNTNKDRYE